MQTFEPFEQWLKANKGGIELPQGDIDGWFVEKQKK